jgi:hypothetical protein
MLARRAFPVQNANLPILPDPMNSFPSALFLAAFASTASAGVTWKTVRLCDEFHAEGAAAGDFNKDGKMDVAYGPYWWEGPEFKTRHTIYDGKPYDPRGYSKNFFAYSPDLNKDGWADVLVLGFPGDVSYWFENPKGADGLWKRHDVFKVTDNESPHWVDITGDGKPEVVCSTGGFFGYAGPGEDPGAEWLFTKITGDVKVQRFTHGLGVGDVNGDKRPDLLEKNGWWEQPADTRTQPEWKFHAQVFSEPGGAQMFAQDLDGDGDQDVFTSLAAHRYGLAWFEQKDGQWVRHDLMAEDDKDPKRPRYSELHAIDNADFNGDGVRDFVTGKRFWSHAPSPDGSGGEPGTHDPAVLYWYEVKPGGASGKAEFIPHLIHNDSGVGTQVTAVDVDGNGVPDVVVGNKKGCFVSFGTRE